MRNEPTNYLRKLLKFRQVPPNKREKREVEVTQQATRSYEKEYKQKLRMRNGPTSYLR